MSLQKTEPKYFRESDKIIKHLLDPKNSELSEKQKEKMERYSHIRTLRGNYSKPETVAIYMQKYGVGRYTAYQDLREAEYIFGKIMHVDKDFERALLLSMSTKNLQLALKSGDSEKLTKALLAHAKIVGLHKDDQEKPDFSMLQASITNIILPSELSEGLHKLIASGAVDLSKVISDIPAVDISKYQKSDEDE